MNGCVRAQARRHTCGGRRGGSGNRAGGGRRRICSELELHCLQNRPELRPAPTTTFRPMFRGVSGQYTGRGRSVVCVEAAYSVMYAVYTSSVSL